MARLRKRRVGFLLRDIYCLRSWERDKGVRGRQQQWSLQCTTLPYQLERGTVGGTDQLRITSRQVMHPKLYPPPYPTPTEAIN